MFLSKQIILKTSHSADFFDFSCMSVFAALGKECCYLKARELAFYFRSKDLNV